MRQRNPVLIAKEYVQPSEPPQVRKNALTALALLGEPEGWAVLTDVALTDLDASVREQAEQELSGLSADVAPQAIVPIMDCLVVPAKSQSAYALLGRLRNRGMPFDLPSLPLMSRIWLARSMCRRLDSLRGVFFHLRTLKGWSLGVLAAWSILMLFCGVVLDIHVEVGSALLYLFLGWLLAGAISVLATLYTSPARYHADVLGGAILDVAVAALVAVGCAALTALVWTVPTGAGPSRPWLLLVLGPLTAAAVRAGTLSVFGVLRTPWQNRLLQLVVGGACGIAVFEIALLVSSGNNQFLNESWPFMLLASHGLAAAYAWIDGRSTPLPVVSRRTCVAGLALASIAVLLPLSLVIPPRVTIPHVSGDVSADLAFTQIASHLSWAQMRERWTQAAGYTVR